MWEEITVGACYKLMMVVDNNILMIIGDPQGILDLQLKPNLIPLLNGFIIIILS
jgi:hypothetical protein